MTFQPKIKGELQHENKLISYERVFKMLENDMYIAGIGQAVLELLSFKVVVCAEILPRDFLETLGNYYLSITVAKFKVIKISPLKKFINF